jgi:hypothetical protein
MVMMLRHIVIGHLADGSQHSLEAGSTDSDSGWICQQRSLRPHFHRKYFFEELHQTFVFSTGCYDWILNTQRVSRPIQFLTKQK